MIPRRSRGKSTPPTDEPLFIAVKNDNPEMVEAHALAAATTSVFKAQVLRAGDHAAMCCAKLRFRDPDLSEQLGEDRFLFLWLNEVRYHPDEGLYSGVFFELPPELTKWHQVGERLGFEEDEIFDWMVNDNGHLQGGFTMRVARAHLPPSDRKKYDEYTGVTVWEPAPKPET